MQTSQYTNTYIQMNQIPISFLLQTLLYIIKITNNITWTTRHSYGKLKRALEKETLITDTDKLTKLPPVMSEEKVHNDF